MATPPQLGPRGKPGEQQSLEMPETRRDTEKFTIRSFCVIARVRVVLKKTTVVDMQLVILVNNSTFRTTLTLKNMLQEDNFRLDCRIVSYRQHYSQPNDYTRRRLKLLESSDLLGPVHMLFEKVLPAYR